MPRTFSTAFAALVSALLSMLVCGAALAAPKILVYGDSLSAAYGIAQARGWVSLLEERIRREKLDYSVVNASISGETTSGGLSRLRQALDEHRPAIVILELGANDGLRGLPVAEAKNNLAAMIRMAQKSRARVLLVGVRMPPNYGPDYTREFDGAFAELARRHRVALVPFLLEGIAERRELFQADGMHPTEAAQPVLLDNVWRKLGPMIGRGRK
jgi:acyl-CoA thioesterase-1